MKKILYVEDNPDTAEAVKIILTGAGFETETVETGKEGIKKASKTTYDLFLLDIMLPDMSGWDIHETLKNKYKVNYAFLSAIPISTERLEQLKKDGVSDYILKPFSKKDLIERVTKILK